MAPINRQLYQFANTDLGLTVRAELKTFETDGKQWDLARLDVKIAHEPTAALDPTNAYHNSKIPYCKFMDNDPLPGTFSMALGHGGTIKFWDNLRENSTNGNSATIALDVYGVTSLERALEAARHYLSPLNHLDAVQRVSELRVEDLKPVPK